MTSRKKFRKKLKLSKEDIFGIAVSDFFYYLKWSRNLKKKKIRNGERGLRQSRNIFSDGKNAVNTARQIKEGLIKSGVTLSPLDKMKKFT